MTGINNTKDEMVQAMKKLPVMAKNLFLCGVINEQERNTLLSCIQSADAYLRNHYQFNIKLHDRKSEHCAHFGKCSF